MLRKLDSCNYTYLTSLNVLKTLLNKQSCFLYYYPVTSVHMPFVNCMESTDGSVKDVATKCASDLQINLSDTWSCTTSKLGNILQHNNAVLTENLKPTHTYVPWVTLNGVHTETIEQEAEKDLVKLICHTYKVSFRFLKILIYLILLQIYFREQLSQLRAKIKTYLQA